MKNISAWAIRHPVTPVVLFVVLFFLGVVAFIRLPINLDPDVSFPLVNVNISQPGAAPTEMETQIAQKVEGSISSIGNVRNITTSIVEGQVSIFVQFEIGTPIDRAVTDVRDAVAKVRNDLPQGIFEPQVTRERRRRRLRVLRGDHHHSTAGAAQLVHRQHRDQAIARDSRRRAGVAQRRRRPRDPGRTRSRPAAGSRPHRRRGQ